MTSTAPPGAPPPDPTRAPFREEDQELPSISPVYLDDLPPSEHPLFRSTRFGPAELGSVRVEVIVRLQGREHPCRLHNVSTSGIGFEWPTGAPAVQGDRLSDLSVLCERQELYRGDCRVRTIRDLDGCTIVGVSFLDSPMNMDDVQQLRAIRERDSFQQAVIAPAELPWHTSDARAHPFEALVAELHIFLVEARARFAKLERDLPWQVLHGEKHTPARGALVAQLRAGFVPAFVDYSRRIDAALRAAPAADRDKLRSFSRALLHEDFMQSPLMHRCLTKPLGYPGDYVVMRYLYVEGLEGPDLFAKAVHLGGVSTPACDAVRGRKDLVLRTLRDVARARADRGLRTRVISIAAGPAQETFELIHLEPTLAPWLDVLLFDQDQAALEHVHQRLTLLRAEGIEVHVDLHRDTIRRLLDDESLFACFGPTDFIFSCGIFDYLRFHTGVRLLRNLFRLLAPGGRLLAGNLVPEQPTRWIFDHHLDWFLEYRAREELLAMGEAAAPQGHPTIVEEASGFNPFVRLTRSA